MNNNENMEQEHAQEASADKAIAMVDEEEGVVENSSSAVDEGTSDEQNENHEESESTKRNLNSYYGNRLGILQSLSLLLNAGLMVYAHVGLSAVILSSRPPIDQQTRQMREIPNTIHHMRRLQNTTQDSLACNEQDFEVWQSGGQANSSINSNFCAREYNGGCFLNVDCLVECFETVHGYSTSCSACFAAVPGCSVESGCAFICAADSLGAECRECIAPCNDELDLCLNFARFSNGTTPSPTPPPTVDPTNNNATGAQGDSCVEIDLDAIDEWYVVYELTFVDSIKKAWNGDARFLAFIVVLFSGIWPYAKNIILMFAWYMSMTVEKRNSVLVWLSRLSKYTLVDVFAVITILVGVLLQLDVGGTEVAIRGEPRPSIIAFFVATLWEFAQIEWTLRLHNRHVTFGPSESEKEPVNSSLLGAMRFRSKMRSNEDCIPANKPKGIGFWVAFLFVSTLATYLSGAILELIRFTSLSPGDAVGCKRSYNLVTFGNAMVSDLALTDNSAKPGTWTLYIVYVLLVLCFPIAVHTLQVITLVLRVQNEKLFHLAGWIWGFSSIEVLLIGLFSVEHSFDKFMASLAGNENAQFFSIRSGLGAGFYILIGYSFAAGLLQYFVQCAVSEYYKIDPYHKVNMIWTKSLGCWVK